MPDYTHLFVNQDPGLVREFSRIAREEYVKRRFRTKGDYDGPRDQRRHNKTGPGVPRDGQRKYIISRVAAMLKNEGLLRLVGL